MEENKIKILVNKTKDKFEKYSFRFHKFVKKYKNTWFVIIWNTILFYLFFGFVFNQYSIKMLGFAFSGFLIYQILLGDIVDSVLAIKNN